MALPSSGILLGYARVSTPTQILERQIDALTQVGVDPTRIYSDKRSGSNNDRPGLNRLLEYARDGDVIVVHTLDRVGRNLRDVLNLIHTLDRRGIGVRSLADPLPIDTRDSGMGRVAVLLLALFGEMERTFATERAAHARAVAEAKGRRTGRPIAHKPESIEYARLLRAQAHSLGEIVRRTGIPKTSLYRYLQKGSNDARRPAA